MNIIGKSPPADNHGYSNGDDTAHNYTAPDDVTLAFSDGTSPAHIYAMPNKKPPVKTGELSPFHSLRVILAISHWAQHLNWTSSGRSEYVCTSNGRPTDVQIKSEPILNVQWKFTLGAVPSGILHIFDISIPGFH